MPVHEKPKMIICGASAYSRDWDYERLREIADEVGALLAGRYFAYQRLIAKGLLNDPIPHCHIVTTTTHKTLRGPRGGVIMMGEDFENPFGIKTPKGRLRMMSQPAGLSGVFPGTQGGPLEHIIAAKAVAFSEALSDQYHALHAAGNKKCQCHGQSLCGERVQTYFRRHRQPPDAD